MKQFYSLLRVICLLCPLILTSFFATCDDEPSNPPPHQIDSTSHSFVFFTDTIGTVLSRVNDVFCLSESEAYAVGLFYVRDSTGKVVDSLTCNFARWDGMKWKLERVNPKLNGMETFTEAYCIYGISTDDIWIGATKHWDGKSWKAYDVNAISTGRTRKIWYRTSNDVWFAGENGSIMHWDGERFVRKGEITTAANCDIWGWKDTIYVATSDYDRKSGSPGYVTLIKNGEVVRRELLDGVQISVWGMNGTWYSGGCSPLYKNSGLGWQKIRETEQCIKGIRGTAQNNFCVIYQRGKIVHYNGWTFQEILPEETSGIFFPSGISAVGNTVFFGGSLNSYAIVKRGYQQPVIK